LAAGAAFFGTTVHHQMSLWQTVSCLKWHLVVSCSDGDICNGTIANTIRFMQWCHVCWDIYDKLIDKGCNLMNLCNLLVTVSTCEFIQMSLACVWHDHHVHWLWWCTVLDMACHVPLYRALLELLRAVAVCPPLMPLLLPLDADDDSSVSISYLLDKMKQCVDTYASRLKYVQSVFRATFHWTCPLSTFWQIALVLLRHVERYFTGSIRRRTSWNTHS